VPTFDSEQLAQWTAGRWTASPATPLTAFSLDSRKLRAGDVFVALKTDRRDGHDFLLDAQSAGASAAVVAAPNSALTLPQLVVADPLEAFQTIAREHRRGFRRPVVGISGSAGKTSTKDLLALLLGGASSGVVATEGNLNNHLGVPLTLTRIDPAKHHFAVIEAGISRPGEMAVLAGMIEPDVTIITLVAPAHTEDLGGIDGVAREKAVLSERTRPHGVAIFPRSVAEFSAFREQGLKTLVVEKVEVLLSGEPVTNRVHFTVSQQGESTAVALAINGQPRDYVFRRVSDGMAQNAALAITAAYWLGVSDETIQTRLASWKPGNLRGEIRWIDGRLFYLDCYNANPASMTDALAAFEAIAPTGEARLFVLGCMEELGAEAAAHHQALGRSLRLREEDQLFVIGTHAHDVCAGVLQQGDFSRQIQIVSTLEPVSAFLSDWRGSVFIKGSRRYQLEKVLEVQTSFPLPC
jgi:UDP-N-acetylmuramoyl-tripeptide--D-alanyl-D-alanine ligase